MTKMKKSLKTKVVNDKEYRYLEYSSGDQSIGTDYFVKFKADTAFKKTLEHIGGMSYDLIVAPFSKDASITHLSIMFYLMDNMQLVTLVKHCDDDGNVVDYKFTKSYLFLNYILKFVNDRRAFVIEEGSTFNHLDDEHINKLGLSVYEPKTINDMGFIYKGEVLEYNRFYVIGNINEMQNTDMVKILNKFKPTFNIKEVILKTNESESAFGDVASLIYIKDNGEAVSFSEDEYVESGLAEDISYEEYMLKEEIEEIKYVAEKINERINQVMPHNEDETKTNQSLAMVLFGYHEGQLANNIEYLQSTRNKAYKQRVDKSVIATLAEEGCLIKTKGVTQK